MLFRIVCLVLLLGPCASYRGGPAVYDVEVREVDAATLRHILQGGGQGQGQARWPGAGAGAGAGAGGNQFELRRSDAGHISGVQGPNGQWYPVQQGHGMGQGQEVKAHFVSPSGQVYTLKTINGQAVLVGPDGRWHPLNGQGGGGQLSPEDTMGNMGRPSEPDMGLGQGEQGGKGGQGGQGGHGQGGQSHKSPHRPPGPSGPNYEDAEPTYDRQGGGPKDIRDAEDCVASQTTFNGGKRACRLQLLLEEHFDILNLTLWKHDVLMPQEPDFEFVAYDKDPDNTYCEKSILHIKPTLMEDSYGPGFVMNGTLSLDGCTSTRQEDCTRTASTYRVLPPVRSARLTTRDTFSFQYGIVEARVLVPEGDWIYPAFTLEPASNTYGKWYASGQIRLPYTVGNRFLSDFQEGPKTGLQVLRAGVAIGKNPGEDIVPTVIEKELRASDNSNWRKKHFRVYRMKWTPDYIEFSLDGKSMGQIRPPAGGFVSMTDNPADHPWSQGTKMAPFDQEFFLSIGVGVGGVNRFSDNSANGEYFEHPKPWKNSIAQRLALLDFYKARDHWIPTWLHPALEVAHFKVWAL